MQSIITEETDHMIAWLAFHWYSGDHFEALVCVILNTSEDEIPAYIRIGQEAVKISVLPKAITTFIIEK